MPACSSTRRVRFCPQLAGNPSDSAICETGLPDLYAAMIFATSNFTRLNFVALPTVISFACFFICSSSGLAGHVETLEEKPEKCRGKSSKGRKENEVE